MRGDGKNGLLPLPCHDTMNRLIRGIPGTFGLNDFSIDAIGRNLSGKNENLRKGSLVWDEMSVKKSMKFNQQRMKFDGLVDYGDEMITEKSDKVADHALVLMFRPYRAKWVQPIGVYATSGAASAYVIQSLVVKAIMALEKKDAVVMNVVCDGHQTNKGVHNLFDVSEKMGEVCNYIKHPCNPKNKIYFLFDIPHIMKCIRNQIFKQKYVQVINL